MDMLFWLFLAVLFTIAGLFLLYWKLFYWMDTAEPLLSEKLEGFPDWDRDKDDAHLLYYFQDEPDPSQEVQLPLPFTNRPRESSSSEQKDEEEGTMS